MYHKTFQFLTQKRNSDKLQFELEHGLSYDSIDKNGETLLCSAIGNENYELMKYLLEMHGDKVEITISAQDVNRFEELLTMYNIQQTPETADINYKKSRSIVGACLVVLFAVLLLCKDGICSILGIDQTSKFGDLAISAILFLPLFVAMFLFGKNLLAKKTKRRFCDLSVSDFGGAVFYKPLRGGVYCRAIEPKQYVFDSEETNTNYGRIDKQRVI